MSKQDLDLDTPDLIESDIATRWETHGILSTSVSSEVIKLYALHATNTKKNIDELAAEVSKRQDQLRFLNELITEINSLTDENNGLDITDNPALQEKLAVAKELGIKIPEKQMKFNPTQRDRLVENLHLTADNWDKDNKKQTQKMEIFIKDLDRVLMLLKEVQKAEKQPKQAMISGMKGG